MSAALVAARRRAVSPAGGHDALAAFLECRCAVDLKATGADGFSALVGDPKDAVEREVVAVPDTLAAAVSAAP